MPSWTRHDLNMYRDGTEYYVIRGEIVYTVSFFRGGRKKNWQVTLFSASADATRRRLAEPRHTTFPKGYTKNSALRLATAWAEDIILSPMEKLSLANSPSFKPRNRARKKRKKKLRR